MTQDSELLYPRKPELAKDEEMVSMSPTSVVNVSSPYAPKAIPLLLGPENTTTICPFCNSNIKTSVKYRSTTRTHITAALCCLICCCCCIPYCMDSAKNSDHYCPSCSSYIGTYEK
ncbi:lipopolysaccharide-induced tumor necrosis factor-alpha factor homolog [Maniola jurtina]|uniref:lipopolysaccharide-induced tumor necrosis factor-alpha factor homolog n=1 Tax=Maniola jurtina TaxID=191418 RepID=UPI001E68A207|nr:lipopolysaccharide-induced tumor necrosis factor-alpha factor homolog [Maniola jurtina]